MSDDLDGAMEDLEVQAEIARLEGNPPVTAGLTCEYCGVTVEVPWDERDSLTMLALSHVCPIP